MHAPGLTRQSTQYAWRAVDYIVYHTHSGHPDHNDPHLALLVGALRHQAGEPRHLEVHFEDIEVQDVVGLDAFLQSRHGKSSWYNATARGLETQRSYKASAHVYAEETARWTNDPSLHKVKRNDPFCLGV